MSSFEIPFVLAYTEPYDRFNFYTSRLQLLGVLDDVYVDFELADTAKQKFMVTRAMLTKYDIVPESIENSNSRYNDTVAKNIRTRGNGHFLAKNYFAAIRTYTESLMNSEPGSECWAYALANRSAALFRAKHYRKCLADIGRALRSKYPAGLMYKLYERAGHAERLLGHGDLAKLNYNECLKHLDGASMACDQKNSFIVKIVSDVESCESCTVDNEYNNVKTVDEVLLGGKNDRAPALSNYLELKCSTIMGRGVYAIRDINPGDIVAIDEPYICGPLSEFNVCTRTSCLKLSTAAIPCPKCLLVIYCDEECMEKAYEEHHVICPIMCSIAKIPGNRHIYELVMNWFLRECSQMGLEKFCSVVDQLSTTKIDNKTRGFDENGLYKSDNFLTAYTLDVGENKLSMDVLFFFNCICVQMLQYLMLSGFHIPKCYLSTVGASLVHMLRILDTNCLKTISDCSAVNPLHGFTLLSTTVYSLCPSICLFNHSCDPNVMRCGRATNKRRVLRAIQPVPKGNQLFISYGTAYKFHDKKLREEFCLNFFISKCFCQPCLENWPTKRFLPNRLSLKNIINPDNDKISMLSSECEKFIEIKKTLCSENIFQHLNFLYYFLKLLFTNVKRPFALYEECAEIICKAHLSINYEDDDLLYKFYNEL